MTHSNNFSTAQIRQLNNEPKKNRKPHMNKKIREREVVFAMPDEAGTVTVM